MDCRARKGFTLIEAIVTIFILLLTVAVALPAIARSRETSRRSQCKSSLKDIGLALHNYESAYKRFPSGGKGTFWNPPGSTHAAPSPEVNPVLTPNGTAFDPQSTFTALLPYFGSSGTGFLAAGPLPYNTDQETLLGRQTRAQARLQPVNFLCPSNRMTPPDPEGYGQTDFAPTVFVDIAIAGSRMGPGIPLGGAYDPATSASRRSRRDGCLALGGTPMGLVTDGTSNTIAIAESVGRRLVPGGLATSPHRSPAATQETCGSADGTATVGYRCPNRWADPDNGIGVSGPPVNRPRAINNHATPIGGPPECPWSTENCGPNDELFGFHTGGVQAVFADGAVRFLSENLDTEVLAKLVARSDGELTDLPGCGSASVPLDRARR